MAYLLEINETVGTSLPNSGGIYVQRVEPRDVTVLFQMTDFLITTVQVSDVMITVPPGPRLGLRVGPFKLRAATAATRRGGVALSKTGGHSRGLSMPDSEHGLGSRGPTRPGRKLEVTRAPVPRPRPGHCGTQRGQPESAPRRMMAPNGAPVPCGAPGGRAR